MKENGFICCQFSASLLRFRPVLNCTPEFRILDSVYAMAVVKKFIKFSNQFPEAISLSLLARSSPGIYKVLLSFHNNQLRWLPIDNPKALPAAPRRCPALIQN